MKNKTTISAIFIAVTMGKMINFYEYDKVKQLSKLTDDDIAILNTTISQEQIAQWICTMQHHLPQRGKTTIMLDVEKINNSWKSADADFYVSPPNENKVTW